MSVAITSGIRVEVASTYVPGRSAPQKNLFFFSYQVTIKNESEGPVQLMTRHWTITDGTGKVEEVRGPGVVGAQPRLEPGESFQYESFCPLPTQVGTMLGTYQMVNDQGEQFDVDIAPFTLHTPHSLN